MTNNFIEIPTWDRGSWTYTEFDTRDRFRDYVDKRFKEPGKYQFNSTSEYFNEEARRYKDQGDNYCLSPFRSKDYIEYWDNQKEKCRKGVIFRDSKHEWYLPREYYMWLNFLPIFNKEKRMFSFADVRDIQYHLSLYELRAELHYKHASLLKKRQMASSYFHCAKLINQIWFEEGVVLKIGASLKDYINTEGIWKFLDEYRSFLNEKTAWIRPMNPGKVLMWQQKIEVEENGRKIDKGLKGTLQGVTFEQSPTKGVGGPCLSPDTLIICEGFVLKPVKDITIDDKVIGADGFPKKILQLFSGHTNMYKVSQSNGDDYNVTQDHSLFLYDTKNKKYKIIKAKAFESLSDIEKSILKGIRFDIDTGQYVLSRIHLESIGKGDYNGFECEDNLFLLKDRTITHNCSIFYYEESGIAPTLDKTYEYMRPALQSGDITTGLFVAAGSVGDLDHCKPLKELTYYPERNDILPVESNLLDENWTYAKTGLFIPEQWGMPPYIDKYGNSQVDKALEALEIKFDKWKKELSPENYQLRVSQHPRNIKEAFAFRKVSIFPVKHTTAQKRRIEDKQYPFELVELYDSDTGEIKAKTTTRPPISQFPIDPRTEDKTGSIVIWERPDKDAPWGTYYASVDPVAEGKTQSSVSLCSIYIYKNPVEVTKQTAEGNEVYIEPDKIVAAWCGRYDDVNETHATLCRIVQWYNAWTLVENNVTHFIQYMIRMKKQKYLVPKNQIVFLKELGANNNVYQEYGWKNTGSLFKDHLLSYLIDYLGEVLDQETKPDGTVVRTIYGVERIPDIMAIVEMENYEHGVNVDRLVSLAALVAFAKMQQANRGYIKRTETDSNLEKSSELYKLNKSMFRNMGRSVPNSDNPYKVAKKPFRTIK
jgi:hypothetical protein